MTKKSTKVSEKADSKKDKKALEKYFSLSASESDLRKFARTASIDDLVTIVMERTDRWAKKYGFIDDKEKKKERDPKAVQIERMFQSGEVEFGCKNDRAMRLFSILLGEEICKDSKGKVKGHVEIYALTGVVMLNNPNSHDYGTGKPVVMYKNGVAGQLKVSGNSGNNLPNEGSAYRPAERDEVIQYFGKVEDAFRRLV